MGARCTTYKKKRKWRRGRTCFEYVKIKWKKYCLEPVPVPVPVYATTGIVYYLDKKEDGVKKVSDKHLKFFVMFE